MLAVASRCRLSLVHVDPLPLLNTGESSIVLVWSMLPGEWPNQIVKNLFALINVKENGRSEGTSRCNCGHVKV